MSRHTLRTPIRGTTRQRCLRLASVALVVASVAACAGVQTRRTDLRDAVHSYNIAVRWGHVQKASAFVPAKQRAEFVARKRRAMATMRIHEVVIRNVQVKAQQTQADVLVQVSFSVGSDPTIRTHLVAQRWRYLSSQWLLTSRKRVEPNALDSAKPGDLY